MVSQTAAEFRTLHFEERVPKLTDKHRVPIIDHSSRHAVKTKNLPDEDVSNFGSRIGVFNGYEMAILGETIDHNQYGVTTMSGRKTLYKVHCNVCPELSGGLEVAVTSLRVLESHS